MSCALEGKNNVKKEAFGPCPGTDPRQTLQYAD